MGAELFDVKSFVVNWKEDLRRQVNAIGEAGSRKPSLTIVQIGDNEASNRYIRNKIKDCKEVGIFVDHYKIPEDSGIDQWSLNRLINDCETSGVMIQLPVPTGLNPIEALHYTTPAQDVDGLLPNSLHTPATALGIVKFLDAQGYSDGSSKTALVIGRSEIVGKPIAKLLLERDWTVVQAHSKTDKEFLDMMVAAADLTVCAVGIPGFLNLAQSKDGSVVVDVGINFDESGKMVGDCWNHENARGVKVTPVPGGVGLLTRCALLENVIEAWSYEH